MLSGNKEDLIYAAGFFDGEGCVYIGRHLSKKKTQSTCHFLICTVTQKEPEIITWFFDRFKGSVRPPVNNSTCYQWKVCSKQAEDFLRALLPYLKLKKPQARIALDYRKTIQGSGQGKNGGRKVSDKIVNLRDYQREQISKLNTGGFKEAYRVYAERSK